MKKLILCVLIAVFSLSSINICAYEENAIETKRCAETEFLQAYGFTETVDAKTNNSILRGEFSVLAAKLLGFGIDSAVAVVPFSDVKVEDKCYNAVSQLSSAGIIDGCGDSSFRPLEPINVEHACKILVNILGYSHYAKNSDFITAAHKLNLLSGITVSPKGEISEYSAFMMIYNALNADTSKSNSVDGISIERGENTILSERFKIYEMTGIVSDDGITAFTSKSLVKHDEIVIENTVFKAKGDMKGLIGHELTVWYKTEKSGKNVIGFYKDISGDNIITYDALDIEDYNTSLNTYSVFEKGRLKNISIKKDFCIIYNNVAYTNPKANNSAVLKKIMMPKSGSVKLIKTNSNKYDLVVIKDYKNYMVSAIDSQTMTLYDKNKLYPYISFANTEMVVIKNADGRKVDFKDIPVSSVVSVAQSEENIYAELIVSLNVASGKLETWAEDEMKIGEETFKFTPEYKELIDAKKTKLPTASSMDAYITFDGKILYCDVSNGDGMEFVYICDIENPEGRKNSFSITVYTQANELKAVPCAEKVRIDGVLYTDYDDMRLYLLENKYAKDNIAAVRFNDKNELCYIDLAHNPYTDGILDLKNNDLRIAGNIWRSEAGGFKNKYLGGACATGTDTVAFVVSKNGDWEDIWALPVSKITNIFTETMSAYTFNPDSLIADAIILYRNAPINDITVNSIASINPIYVVSDITMAINDSGNEAMKLTVTTNGSQFTEFYTETVDGAKCFKSGRSVVVGDVVMFGLSKNNRIPDGNLAIMYRAKTDEMFYNSIYFDNRELTYRSAGLISGWLNRMTKTHFELSKVNPNSYASDLDIPTQEKVIFINNMSCIVYDRNSREDKVTIGGVSDFSPYDGGNNPECAKVLVHVTGDTTKFIYVVK